MIQNGTNLTSGGGFFGSSGAVPMVFYGIDGIGAINESKVQVGFFRKSAIAADMIMRANNPLGGGFKFGYLGGELNLNEHMLTLDMMHAQNSSLISANMDVIGTGGIIKTGAGSLTMSGNGEYTGDTQILQGSFALIGAGHISNSNSVRVDGILDVSGLNDRNPTTSMRDISGSGSIILGGKSLILTDAKSIFSGAITGTGGVLVNGGNWVLDQVTGALGGQMSVGREGRLEGTGSVGSLSNAGQLVPGLDGSGTLTIEGDYVGNDGTLIMATVLNDDASSKQSTQLVVKGSTSGNTQISVINKGGTGARTREGIRLIEVDGQSDGKFTLKGTYLFEGEQAVVAGAYAYRLHQGGTQTPGDGDWYLRSSYLNPHDPEPQPLYSPSVPLYEAYADVLQSFNELGTLQQRVGNRSWGPGATPQGADIPNAGPVNGNAIWARIEAAHTSVEPERSTTVSNYDTTVWKLQAGLDGLLYENEAGTLLGGLTAHFGTVSSNVASVFGNGSIDATGYGFGGTLTWYGDNGFYVDGQAEATWYNSDIRSATLGKMLADGNNGFGYALSVEAGQNIALHDGWSLTPQAQLAYSSVHFDDFTDPYGAAVSLGDGDRLVGRLGLSADYESQWTNATGQVSRSHVYGIGNVYYDFLGGSNVDVSGVGFASRDQALWGGIGLGGSLSWDDGRYTVHGEALAKTSLEDFGDSNSIGAKVGFSVKW